MGVLPASAMKQENKSTINSQSNSRALFKSLSLNVISNLLLYVGHLIIARRLPRDDYATFVVVTSIVSLSALFADLGLMGLFIRKFAEAEALAASGSKDTRGDLLGSMLAFRLGLAIAVSIGVLFTVQSLGYTFEIRHLVSILLVTFFISSRLVIIRSVGEAFLRAANKYHVVAALITVDAIVFTLLLYLYSITKLDLETAVWIYAFCHLPGFLLLWGIIYREAISVGFKLRFRFAIIISMLKESAPLILSTAFLTIHSQADPLLLDKLSSPKEVSAYGAGMRVLSAIIFLPAVFSGVIGPSVTYASVTGDYEKIRSTLDRSIRLLLTCALFIAIMLSVSSELVTNLLFGTGKYSDAAPLVTIFGWTFIPICFASFLTEIAVAEGKFWIPVLFTSLIMVTSIVCDLLFIPIYGALGTAIAKCIAVSIGSIALLLTSYQLKVLDRAKIGKLFLQLGEVAACMIGILYFLNSVGLQSILLTCIMAVVSLLIIVFIFKIISYAEIRLFVLGFFAKSKISESQE
ncbi:MAG: oligosaccharide flippase family protein [Ignavibacteriota bacterium]